MTRNLQGLISYGPDLRGQYIDGATYVDHILRGAKPADLPVRFATKLELVVSFWYCRADRGRRAPHQARDWIVHESQTWLDSRELTDHD